MECTALALSTTIFYPAWKKKEKKTELPGRIRIHLRIGIDDLDAKTGLFHYLQKIKFCIYSGVKLDDFDKKKNVLYNFMTILKITPYILQKKMYNGSDTMIL